MPLPGLLHPEPLFFGKPLLTCAFTGDTQTQFCLRLCGVSGSWCPQGLFEPTEHLSQVQGLILNMILPLLLPFWGFSFALGHGLSLQSRSRPVQLLLQCYAAFHLAGASLPLDMGYLLKVTPTPRSHHSSAPLV